MAEQLDIFLVEHQFCATEFSVRLGESGSETIQLIHQAYGDDAMRRAAVFMWWKPFRGGETNVKNDQDVKTACSTILLKLAANGLQHVFEKWVGLCKKHIACQGRYFEKETVTVPRNNKVSPRTSQTDLVYEKKKHFRMFNSFKGSQSHG
jgi:hypothetical protein